MKVDRAAVESGGSVKHELEKWGSWGQASEEGRDQTSVALLMIREVILLSGLKLNFNSGSWLYCRGGAEWREVESSPTGAVVSHRTGIWGRD